MTNIQIIIYVKCYYTSFATHNYGGALDTQSRLSDEALKKGLVDRTILYREEDIPHFISRVDELFSNVNHRYKRFRHSRYFTWKPQVILKTFNLLSHGDYVIYHDAGRQCYNYKIDRELRSFCDYVTEYHNGIFVNFSGWKNSQHTKKHLHLPLYFNKHYTKFKKKYKTRHIKKNALPSKKYYPKTL